jgi:hypothetical protein
MYFLHSRFPPIPIHREHIDDTSMEIHSFLTQRKHATILRYDMFSSKSSMRDDDFDHFIEGSSKEGVTLRKFILLHCHTQHLDLLSLWTVTSLWLHDERTSLPSPLNNKYMCIS